MKNIFISTKVQIKGHNKSKKLSLFTFDAKRLVIAGFSLLSLPVMVSCHNGKKADYKQKGNNVVHCNLDMKYNLDRLEMDSDYYYAALNAINAVNKNSSFSFEIVDGRDGITASHFYTYSTWDGYNAYNDANKHTNSKGLVEEANIHFNTNYMDSYSLDSKKTLAIHEMGHTLGLRDLTDERVIGHSVMYKAFGNGSPTFTDYPEYDRENIKWYYKGTWK